MAYIETSQLSEKIWFYLPESTKNTKGENVYRYYGTSFYAWACVKEQSLKDKAAASGTQFEGTTQIIIRYNAIPSYYTFGTAWRIQWFHGVSTNYFEVVDITYRTLSKDFIIITAKSIDSELT